MLHCNHRRDGIILLLAKAFSFNTRLGVGPWQFSKPISLDTFRTQGQINTNLRTSPSHKAHLQITDQPQLLHWPRDQSAFYSGINVPLHVGCTAARDGVEPGIAIIS